MENFKYFQNKKCEYFPCHKINDIEKFNCLFCYCPLYALKDKCGGNPIYIGDIKDCSNCTKTHNIDTAFDFVNSKWNEIKEISKKEKK